MRNDWLDGIRTLTRYALEDGYSLSAVRAAVTDEYERLFETAPAETAYWTRELAVAAVCSFAARWGRRPAVGDARAGRGGLPSVRTAQRLFGSWSGLIAAAGFAPAFTGGLRVAAGFFNEREAA